MKDIYTLKDLPEAFEDGARLAVIGHPIKHSFSPQLHQPALDADGHAYSYIRLNLQPSELEEALSLMATLGFKGCNVTVPHKIDALSLCHHLDSHAKRLGSVNTILFSQEDEQPIYQGFNTDGPGFIRAILDSFLMDVRDLQILILGAGGGAGQAIASQCASEGCERLVLVNRTRSKIDPLYNQLKPYLSDERVSAPSERLRIYSSDDPALEEELDRIDLIVNATSLGLQSSDPLPLPGHWIQANHLVYDTIYNPCPTKFLINAQTRGARTAHGLSLLLHQGILSYQIWHPGAQPIKAMKRAITEIQ